MSKGKFPHAVIFDWDNTLIDTFPLLFEATNLMREKFGKPLLTEAEAKRHIRLSAKDSFPKDYGDKWQEAYAFFLGYVRAHHLKQLDFLPGAVELVRFLHSSHVKLGVFSNKTADILRKEVSFFSESAAFSAIIGSGDFEGAGKPDAAGLLFTAGQMELDKSLFCNVWYVGDTENDLKAARAAGMLPVFMENVLMSDLQEIAAIKPQYTFKNCSECLAHLTTLG